MNIVPVISALLTLTAGVGIFLVACQMMSTNLESASSNKLKALFSEAALKEISYLRDHINQLYEKVKKAYVDEDLEALKEANDIEDKIDDITKKMEDNHIERLSKGICSADVGAQYLSLSSNAERVADHLINVAKTINSYKDM